MGENLTYQDDFEDDEEDIRPPVYQGILPADPHPLERSLMKRIYVLIYQVKKYLHLVLIHKVEMIPLSQMSHWLHLLLKKKLCWRRIQLKQNQIQVQIDLLLLLNLIHPEELY